LQLGRCLLALGRGPEAIEALSGCVAMRPDSPWAYTTRGLASALLNHPDEALFDLDRAVRLDPDFQPARLNRGVAHWLHENFDAAKLDFDAVLAAPRDDRLVEAAYYRGQLLLQQQRVREALADLSTVIDARPDFRPAYWLRAKLRFRLGEYDEGQLDLAKFLALQKSASKPINAQFAMGKALRYLALELDGEAKAQALVRAAKELNAAISAGSRFPEIFQQLGTVQEGLANVREAIASYSKGLELAAGSVPLRNLRGWAYVGAQRFDLARADFSEALRIEPGNPDSHAGLGFVTAQVGQADDARREASAALLTGSDNYLVLHNVACIYGRLSESAKEHKIEHENLAIAALKRAVNIARHIGAGSAEDEYIRQEKEAFPDSLRARPEFQNLLSERAANEP
jgi:tetratricopeptide (TPR) repeat protein